MVASKKIEKKSPEKTPAQPIYISMPERGGVHPFVVFWLGFITGALTVALVFGYLYFETQSIQKTIIDSELFQSN